jgi:hypothetical protein
MIRIRLGRDDVDDTCVGIAPEQRALRSTQGLEPVEIVDEHRRALRARRIETIDVEGNGGIAEFRAVRGDDAAQRKIERGLRRAQADLQVRDQRGHALEIRDLLALHHVRRECGNRDGTALQIGLALLGRDDDFVDGEDTHRFFEIRLGCTRHLAFAPHRRWRGFLGLHGAVG